MIRPVKRLALLLLLAVLPSALYAQDRSPATDPSRTVLVMLASPPDHYRPDASYGGSYAAQRHRSGMLRIARRVARDHRLRLMDDWPMPAIGLDCVVMTITDGRNPDTVAREVSGDTAVAWSQPLQSYRTQAYQSPGAAQSDPFLHAEPAEALWHVSALHRMATGRGVPVAVIDSRIDANHPDLAGRIVMEQDFAPGHGTLAERHGTEVAGIIAARSGNGTGIAGIAPAARLLGLRACWQTNASGAASCDSFSLAKALNVAIERGAKVINMSLTGPPDRLLERLVRAGLAAGATIVAAGDRTQPEGGFPASIPGVVGVVDQPAPHVGSLYGAPGHDIPTTVPGGHIALANGSSFAAAHVSGLMALVRSRSPDAHPSLVRTREGGIDACRTLACARPRLAAACASGC